MMKTARAPLWSLPLRALLFFIGLAVAALPRGLELRLGRAFGRACVWLGLFKQRTVRENIARALPELSADDQRRLLRANYEHYGILFFEFAHFFCPLPGHWRRYAARVSCLENKETWDEAVARGKGALFFSAHLGFWEMSAAAAGLAGLAPTIVTTVLKPVWLHDQITACRASTGVSAAFHPGSMPAVMRALRKGGSVAFMNDQYAPASRWCGSSLPSQRASCPAKARRGPRPSPRTSSRGCAAIRTSGCGCTAASRTSARGRSIRPSPSRGARAVRGPLRPPRRA
ncbi:MAG: hypothetical protein NTX64_13900 [Elusimicrobia bacterium]|nr:hypothetical protein [Elusimicrobiota bacterium]